MSARDPDGDSFTAPHVLQRRPVTSEAVRSEAQFKKTIARLEDEAVPERTQPAQSLKGRAVTIPDMVLDPFELLKTRYINDNGRIADSL